MLFATLLEIIDPEPHSGPMNMAIDEILLRQAEQPTLRVYRWQEPSVSFGYFGTAVEAEGIARGRAIVRRWTGGGMVEHGEDLTYTLVVPREHPFLRRAAPESYRLIHEKIARLLEGEGMVAQVVPTAGSRAFGACFANPVQYDLVAGGVKIAGAAQRRTRWGLLHQGSIRTGQRLVRLGEGLAGVFGAQVIRRSLTGETQAAAGALAEARYGTAGWLRRY